MAPLYKYLTRAISCLISKVDDENPKILRRLRQVLNDLEREGAQFNIGGIDPQIEREEDSQEKGREDSPPRYLPILGPMAEDTRQGVDMCGW